MLLWNIRRRPSILSRVLRSALMVGAAVCVPVGLEVLRRVIRSGKLGMQNGQSSAQRMNESGRSSSASRSSRRRRSASAAART
jgi:hypothetical protein